MTVLLGGLADRDMLETSSQDLAKNPAHWLTFRSKAGYGGESLINPGSSLDRHAKTAGFTCIPPQ